MVPRPTLTAAEDARALIRDSSIGSTSQLYASIALNPDVCHQGLPTAWYSGLLHTRLGFERRPYTYWS